VCVCVCVCLCARFNIDNISNSPSRCCMEKKNLNTILCKSKNGKDYIIFSACNVEIHIF